MKKLVIGSSLVVLVMASVFAFIFYRHHLTQPLKKTVTVSPVLLETAKTTIIPNIATATGTLVADQSTVITPKVSGYVTHIYYHEGDPVKAGDVLLQLDDHAEKENLNAAKTAWELSDLQYKRNVHLYKIGLITQSVYYDSKVKNQQNQATVKADRTQLTNKTIVAPFNGSIGARNISVGDFVNAGTKLTTLVDTQHLRVEYALPTSYLSHLELGQAVTITPSDLPNQHVEGKVSYIAASINPDTQTINVHASITNKNNLLKPGEFVNITQTLGLPKKAIVLPTQSVFASLKGYYIYSVHQNKAVKLPVKVGAKFENTIEITGGLAKGTRVVVAGQQYLSPGQAVTIIHSKD